MDNGTAAWGQSQDAATGWGDQDEPGKASGWGNPSPNPGKTGKKRKMCVIQNVMISEFRFLLIIILRHDAHCLKGLQHFHVQSPHRYNHPPLFCCRH